MCGIAGIFSYQGELATLKSMLQPLVHRGPDDLSCYIDQPFYGGMTRLAINGVEDGNQPLFDSQENVVLFYNGEIYNSKALRADLEAKGYPFKTHSDGEVICHLYHEHGEQLFQHLDGMFAIALWDKQARRLLLARDPSGEKPLYYYLGPNNQCYFASEIKSLQRAGAVQLNLNRQAIWDFPTFLWVPQPDTIYQDVKALMPGHSLCISEKESRLQAYRNPFADYDFATEDLTAQVRALVTESIETRLLSEVPVGAFLSSGLDSSIVTAVASKHMPLTTYCIGFEDIHDPYHGKADESVDAAEYARRLGTNHRTIKVTSQTFSDLLPDFCHFGDQPFAVSSGLGILAVCKQASKDGLKVMLSGDGADEVFGGYSWYRYLSQVKQAQIKPIIETFQSVGLTLEQRLEAISHMPGPMQAYAWHYYAHEADKARLFEPSAFKNIESSLRHFASYKSEHWQPYDFIKHDRQFYFQNEMLTKLDRMSMAYSVEARAPFAAPKIQQLAHALPFEALVGDGLKTVLREAFKDVLPKDVWQRKKHGFNVPVDHWLKHEWQDLLSHTFSQESALYQQGLIQANALTQANQMLAEQRLHGHTLFCYIMLNMWLENEKNRNYC